MKKNIKVILIIMILITFISGCNNTKKNNIEIEKNENESMPTKEEVEQYIEKKYGKYNIVNLVSKNDNKNTYLVQSPLGFNYTLYTEIKNNKGYSKQYYYDTFYKEFTTYEKTDVDSIFNKWNKISTTYKIDNNKLYFYINYNSSDEINIVCTFLYDIRNLLLLYNVLDCDDIKIIINNKEYADIKFSEIDKYDRKDYLTILTNYLVK